MTTSITLPSRRTMLRAVSQRDPAWDGLFLVAVRTTGIVCRPICPSRPARPENLQFFSSLNDARDAGFRPCLRCRPETLANEPAWWPRLVKTVNDATDAKLSDADLKRLGFDPVRVRRHCRRAFGTTFHAWLRARRVADSQRRLRQGKALDQVIIDSTYASHSGFRDAFARTVGTSPGRARDGEPILASTWRSPLGPLVAATVEGGIALLEFGDIERLEAQAPTLRRYFKGPVVAGKHPMLEQLFSELAEYFDGKRQRFDVPLAVRGAPFEESVWQALLKIPYGVTCSYSDVARTIGNPKAVRAVGSANGRNRIAIVIPCHRVVNADGRLGGYGGGLWRKVRLLEIEGCLLK